MHLYTLYLYSSSLFRYSLFEPNDSVQGTHKCELNKALHKNSSLLGELNDAFNGSEPYFYDSSYTPVKHVQAMPVDQHGRCVVSKEIGTSNPMSMRPIKWQCTSECRQPSKEEIEVMCTTKSLFKMSLYEIRQGLDKIDRGCTLVQQAQATIPDTPDNGEQPRVSELHGHSISCEMLSCKCPLRVIRAASTHYPTLRRFMWFLYSVHKSHLAVAHIDKALSSGNVQEVVHTLGNADLFLVFSEDGSENTVFVEDHSVPSLGSIEHHLLISNADVIAEVQAM